MLSFPRVGVTLALDFPNNGATTLRLLENLDAITREAGGAVYAAKDARMSAQSFQRDFPRWRQFAPYIDPRFSSSFWRRVTRAPHERILIFGATSAIAEATAREFARRHAALFLVARNAERLQAIADDLKVRGASSVDTALLDAGEIDRYPELLASATSRLGAIDAALIAHGTLSDQAACECSVERLQQELMTNALSYMALCTLLANRMETQGHGVLAVISSVAGDRGRQSNYVYGSAKAAVTTFASGLRQRLYRKGLRVVTIKPGFVRYAYDCGLQEGRALGLATQRRRIDRRRDGARHARGLYTVVLAADHVDHQGRSRSHISAPEDRPAQHEVNPWQQREDPRAAQQIASRQAPRILQQAEQPLQAHALHPTRRTPFQPGQEIDRCADTQPKSLRCATTLERSRQLLLLRTADRQEAETEWALGLDEAQAALDCLVIANESHRRIVMHQITQAVQLPQPLRLLLAAADQHDTVLGTAERQQRRRQVAARTHARTNALRQPQHVGQHPTVEQDVAGIGIQLAECAVVVQPQQVIDVGRDYEFKAPLAELRRDCRELRQIVIVQAQCNRVM